MLFFVGAIVLPTGSFDAGLPIVASEVECVGSEGLLLNCSVSILPAHCESGEGAAIVCQGKSSIYCMRRCSGHV